MENHSPPIASGSSGGTSESGGSAASTHEAAAQTIRDFLAWLEACKGLRLCEAFKPRYDWYTPVPFNCEHLTREFLGSAKTPAEPNNQE